MDKASYYRKNRRLPISVFIAGLLLWIPVMLLAFLARPQHLVSIAVGQRIPSTVISALDFESVDTAKTELARRQAADTSEPVFVINQEPLHSLIRKLDKVYERLSFMDDNHPDDTAEHKAQAAAAVSDLLEISLSPDELLSLMDNRYTAAVHSQLVQTVRGAWSRGIISSEDKENRLGGISKAGNVALRQNAKTTAEVRSISDLLSVREAAAWIGEQLVGEWSWPRKKAVYVEAILNGWLEPSIKYSPALTDQAKMEEVAAVSDSKQVVSEGTRIAIMGEIADEQTVVNLMAHATALHRTRSLHDRQIKLLGNGVLLLLCVLVLYGILYLIKPGLLYDRSAVWLITAISFLNVAMLGGHLYLSNNMRFIAPMLADAVLPLAMAPLLVSIMIGSSAALCIGIFLSLAAAVVTDGSFNVLIMGMALSVTAAVSGRNVRKRSSVFRAGLFIGLIKMLFILTLGILQQQSIQVLVLQASAALLSGILYSVLALFLIPVLETLFGITTDIRLLELSDMGHPLLQRLALEAPGTYHHSLMVANLAQGAAQTIGANDLLVRVCAYFHDIGKMSKPGFFTENVQFQQNPHDDLSPSMSKLIIHAHVKEGVSMAMRYKLPRPIIDAIQQHHGTGMVSFFYQRALNQNAKPDEKKKADASIREEDFRYDGPTPITREMGIVSLSDSVEAASRSIDKPTPARIKTFVNDIVKNKLLDGQLNNCELTFRELTAIKHSFVFTLTNMLHGRVAYPNDEDQNQKQAENVSPQQEETGTTATDAEQKNQHS